MAAKRWLMGLDMVSSVQSGSTVLVDRAGPTEAELPRSNRFDHMVNATAHRPDATAPKCREQAVPVWGQEGEGLGDQHGVLVSASAGI